MENVLREIMAPFACEVLVLGDRLAALLGWGEGVCERVSQAVVFIKGNFKTQVACGLSDPVLGAGHVSVAFGQAGRCLDYCLLYPEKPVVSPKDCDGNERSKKKAVELAELGEIVELAGKGELTKADERVHELMDEVRSLSIEQAILSIVRLTDFMKKGEPRSRLDLHEIEGELSASLRSFAKADPAKRDMDLDLSNAVRDYISLHYMDKSITLDSVAEHFKISPRRISRVFKNCEKCSVKERLNRIRLEKAVELLEKTDLTVAEIAEKIGMENPTYLFSMFKKQYGATPREYAIRAKISDAGDKGDDC
jgi:AraC-like DNA-binding protein